MTFIKIQFENIEMMIGIVFFIIRLSIISYIY